MSQAQLAGDELTKGFISQVEAGLVRPSLRSLQIIASRLGRSLDYFIGDESLAGAKRRVFHRLAAQAAVERHDWGVVRFEAMAALAQQAQGPERATLLRFLATADAAEGKREQAFERLAEAMALVDANSDPTELAHLLHARGVLYVEHGQLAAVQFEHGDMAAARETVDRCTERAALAGDVRVGAIVDVLRARITLEQGDAEKALRLAEAAGERLAELGDQRQQADALRVAAAADHAPGEYASSDRAYPKAIEILASIEDHPDRSTLAAAYAQKLRARGDLESAFAYLELARDPAASRPGS